MFTFSIIYYLCSLLAQVDLIGKLDLPFTAWILIQLCLLIKYETKF